MNGSRQPTRTDRVEALNREVERRRLKALALRTAARAYRDHGQMIKAQKSQSAIEDAVRDSIVAYAERMEKIATGRADAMTAEADQLQEQGVD